MSSAYNLIFECLIEVSMSLIKIRNSLGVGLGTSWFGYELVWIQVGQKWVTWVRVGLGTSWIGYKLVRSG